MSTLNGEISTNDKNNPFISISIVEDKLTSSVLFVVLLIAYVYLGWFPIIALFMSIFVHELGHYFALRLYNRDVQQIKFTFLGGSCVTFKNQIERDIKPVESIVLGLSGPISGLLIIPVIYILIPSSIDSKMTAIELVFVLNIINLAPIEGYDGKRVYYGIKSYFKNK